MEKSNSLKKEKETNKTEKNRYKKRNNSKKEETYKQWKVKKKC